MILKIRNINIKVKEYNFATPESSIVPPIIFLHDSFGCIELWRDFPEKLAESINCHVLAYDRQGYGQSDSFDSAIRETDYMEKEADVLIDLMDNLKIKKAILFGHSDGATISLIAGAKYPKRISAIISEAAHVFVEEIALSGIQAAVKAYKEDNLKQQLSKYHGDKTELVFKLWAETWLSENFRNWNIEQLLKKIQCPVLVIQGEKDEFGTHKQVESITKNVSGFSEKYILPGVGHTPHKESPELTLKKSVSFIKNVL